MSGVWRRLHGFAHPLARRRVTSLVRATLVAVVASACTLAASSASPSPQATSSSPSPSADPTVAGAWGELRWSAPVVTPDRGSFHDVVSWRDGYAAVGEAIDSGQRFGAAFFSTDGAHWQRTTGVSTFSAVPGVLVTTPNKLIAFVAPFDPGSPPTVDAYTSTDGRSWQRDASLGLRGVSIARVAARDTTLVALGTNVAGQSSLVRYIDGVGWSQGQPPAPRAILRSVTAVRDGFIGVGRDGDPDRSSGGVGVPGVGRPAAWWSADGVTWTALPVEGVAAAGAQLSDVFAVREGYIAVGSDTTDPAVNPRSPLFWSSTDGHDWRLIGPPAHWGTAGANGQQLLVLTRSTNRAAVPDLEAWASLDGRQWTQLKFSGDAVEIPAFEQTTTQPSRVDRILVAPRGVVVLGQQQGTLESWFAEATP